MSEPVHMIGANLQPQCGQQGEKMSNGGGFGRLSKTVESIALAIALIVILGALGFILQILIFTLIAVGAVAVGTVAGTMWIRRITRNARAAQAAQIFPPAGYAAMQYQQGTYLPPVPQQPELPGQHLHLHLAPGMTDADMARAARLLGGDRRS